MYTCVLLCCSVRAVLIVSDVIKDTFA